MLTRLPYNVPKNLIVEALQNLPEFNERISLNHPTGNFFYDQWEIKTEFKDTVWNSILSSLPFEIGEARIIKLGPGQSYRCHADIDDRWHLNLCGDHSYLIDLDNDVMHKLEADGDWYAMDAGRIHTASNYGSTERLQLVVRHLLKNSSHKDLTLFHIRPSRHQHDYRYKFDKIFSPWLNKQNKLGNLSSFSFEGETVSFEIHDSQIKGIMEIANGDFEVTRG